MEIVDCFVRHNIKNDAILIYYVELDVCVELSDIGVILDTLAAVPDCGYRGFDLSEDEDEGRGFRVGCYNLADMMKYYHSHWVDRADTFSFNLVRSISGRTRSTGFEFALATQSLKVVGCDEYPKDSLVEELVGQIEKNIIASRVNK